MRLALASVSAAGRAIGEVVAGVDAVLDEHVAAALDLARFAAAPELLNRVAERRNELGEALRQADRSVRSSAGSQQQPLTVAATIRAARRRMDRLSVLVHATRDVLEAATADINILRPEVEAAESLASAARLLLPRTGQRQRGLTARLDSATGRLRENRPGWWATGTIPVTAAQAEELALSRDPSGELLSAVRETHGAVAAVLSVADLQGWWGTVGPLQAAASAAQGLVPDTSEQRAGLDAAMQAALGPSPGGSGLAAGLYSGPRPGAENAGCPRCDGVGYRA